MNHVFTGNLLKCVHGDTVRKIQYVVGYMYPVVQINFDLRALCILYINYSSVQAYRVPHSNLQVIAGPMKMVFPPNEI